MSDSDLLVLARSEWGHSLLKRYSLVRSHTAVPGDLVTLHGDTNIYKVIYAFADPTGELWKVATTMNPVFYVRKHWSQGKEFTLITGDDGEALYEPV